MVCYREFHVLVCFELRMKSVPCYAKLGFKLSHVILVNMNSSSIQTREIRSRYQFVMHIVCCRFFPLHLYHSIALYLCAGIYLYFFCSLTVMVKKITLTFCPHMSANTHISNILLPRVFEQSTIEANK